MNRLPNVSYLPDCTEKEREVYHFISENTTFVSREEVKKGILKAVKWFAEENNLYEFKILNFGDNTYQCCSDLELLVKVNSDQVEEKDNILLVVPFLTESYPRVPLEDLLTQLKDKQVKVRILSAFTLYSIADISNSIIPDEAKVTPQNFYAKVILHKKHENYYYYAEGLQQISSFQTPFSWSTFNHLLSRLTGEVFEEDAGKPVIDISLTLLEESIPQVRETASYFYSR